MGADLSIKDGMTVRWLLGLAAMLVMLQMGGGCASIRITDPPRTATEQFLLSEAARLAIDQISAQGLTGATLRDRRVFLDSTYFTQTAGEHAFFLGELRAKMFMSGVRLTNKRDEAEIIVEVRSGGLGIDRLDFLLGLPSIYAPWLTENGDVPVAIPELAIVKNTRQRGFASVAFVAYWADTGEVFASSGPFIGRTMREDWWFFGTGPKTLGNIPTTERVDE
jgi:hypothetical protein